LAKQTMLFGEFLARERPELPSLPGRAVVHFHCNHHAVLDTKADAKVLSGLGLDVNVLDSGCCGMAGSFGFEAEHYEVSMKCAERVLLPAVREAADDDLVITDGFSCREQIFQATGRRPLHLAQVLQRAFG
jgi:Fe-S oxidoreductase